MLIEELRKRGVKLKITLGGEFEPAGIVAVEYKWGCQSYDYGVTFIHSDGDIEFGFNHPTIWQTHEIDKKSFSKLNYSEKRNYILDQKIIEDENISEEEEYSDPEKCPWEYNVKEAEYEKSLLLWLDQGTNLWTDGVDNRMKNWESEILNDISAQEQNLTEFIPGIEIFHELDENDKNLIQMDYCSNLTDLHLDYWPDFVTFDSDRIDEFKKILFNNDLPFEFDDDE